MAGPALPIEESPKPRLRVPPTVASVLRPYITAAATLTEASGIAGTLDTTPTAAECDALMLHGTWGAELNIRQLELSLSNHSGLVCDSVRIAVNPMDAITAGDTLVSGGEKVVRLNPGDKLPIGPTDQAITDVYIVWHNSGGGSGYTGAELEIYGVSHA